MKKLNLNNLDDLRIAQIIDANLDRAREGLRVLEDWARFGLGRDDLVRNIKNLRQILGKSHKEVYKKSRNFNRDVSAGLSHPEQMKRDKTKLIISSNAARIQEALRVIEEFSRNHNFELSTAASKIRYEVYNIEIVLLEITSNDFLKNTIRDNNLYFITIENDFLIEKIRGILEGGVKIIQYRSKKLNDNKMLNEAIKIRKLCNEYKALFIVNDRIDIAYASNADGVHLGEDDLDINHARKILGFSKIIGVSASNVLSIKKGLSEGCDYLGIGPLFKTSTKKGKKPLGIENIKKLTQDISVPWFAIGGIKYENLSILKTHNIRKIAMISELINDENPKEKAKMIINYLSDEN